MHALAFGWMEGISVGALVIAIGSLLLTAISMFVLWPLRHSQSELKRMAEQIVDAKILNAQTQQGGINQLINQQLAQIESRLSAGHVHMKELDERDHTLRVEVLNAINELQKVVVTKDDLRALREEFKG